MFEHPSKVCMTYLEHMKLSLELSSIFFIGSLKAILHALYLMYVLLHLQIQFVSLMKK